MSNLKYLRNWTTRLHKCEACEYRSQALRPVGTRGNPDSPVMIVGMNPGVTENCKGIPFVGPAGRELDKVLAFWGIEDPIITNVLNCYVYDNAILTHDAMDFCSKKWLLPLIRNLDPKLIIGLGAWAAVELLKHAGETELAAKSVGKLAGMMKPIKLKGWRGYLAITYHPAYMLRSRGKTGAKATNKFWDAVRQLRLPIQELLHES